MNKIFNKNNLLIFLFFIFISLLLFWKFYFKGLLPFPGNFLISWFEPWKSEHFSNGTILIAHKPVAEDVFRQLIPFKSLAIEMIKNHTLPLWNPYSGAGMPLLATINIGILDPFNILFLFLPFYFAWSLYIAIQPIFIGFFTYLYCKKISLSNKASVFAAASYVFSGFVITRLIFEMYGFAIALLPLILYLLESLLQDKKSKIIYLLPFFIFALIVSTQPQITFYVLSFSIIYFIFRIFQLKNSDKFYKRKIYLLLFLTILGVGISGLQILPTIELFKLSGINTQTSKFIIDKFLVSLPHLLTILIPNYFGNPGTYNYFGGVDYAQTVTYIGFIGSFFALLSLGKLTKKIDLRFFYYFSVLITILLALNWFGSKFVLSLPIPLISTGAPSRIFFLTTFSIIILAGYGYDKWLNFNKKDLKKIILTIFLYLLLILTILIVTCLMYVTNFPCKENIIIQNCRLISLRNTILEVFVFFLFLIPFISFLLVKTNGLLKKTLAIIIILFVIFLGYYNSTKLIPFSPKSSFFPTNDLINFLQTNASNGRAFGIGNANISTDFASYLGYYDPNYYHPLFNEKYRELIDYANTGFLNQYPTRGDIEISKTATLSSELENKRNRLLDLLSIKYLIFKKDEIPLNSTTKNIVWEDNKFYIINNIMSVSRIYLVNSFELIKEPREILNRLFQESFNYKTSVILEKNINNNFTTKDNNKNSSIYSVKYSENKIEINTDIQNDAILVISDNYYPGWNAYVNDKKTTIYRANYSFRAIIVPKGTHSVVFIYKPESLKYGAIISVLSFFILVFSYFFIRNHIFNPNSK